MAKYTAPSGGGGAVDSVFERTGEVTAAEADYTLEQLGDVTVSSAALGHVLRHDGAQFTNDTNDIMFLQIKAGENISKGQAIYISGTHNANVALVGLARSDSAATMPAIGVAAATLLSGEEGVAVTFGRADGIAANFTAGDTLYISPTTAGAVTSTKPTDAAHLIQNLGVLMKAHASNAVVKVTGIGRANDVPNAISYTKISGGTSSQFVKADGSADGTSYIPSTDPAGSITDAGSGVVISSAERTKLSGIADGAEVNVATDLSYTASTRVLASSTGTNATLPEVSAGGDSGLMIGSDKTKVDAITNTGSGAIITSDERTKLSGIETGADVTDATNVASAGAIMDGDFSSNGIMKRTGAGTYGTAVADTDFQSVPAEGAFADGDKTKLDGIASGAQVNVATDLSYTASTRVLASSTGTNATLPEVVASGDSGLITGSDKAKLDGIASGAQVNVATDLSYTASTRVMASSTGTNATLPEVVAAGDSGLMTGTDKTKLDGIAAGAEVNVGTDLSYTPATRVIASSTGGGATLPEVAAGGDSGLMTGTDKAKLDGVAAGAQVNVATDLSYTASTRELASSTGTNATLPEVTAGGDSGLMTGSDKTKLNGIEASADVTDATNVAAAGAVMDSDFSSNGLMKRTGSGTYTVDTTTYRTQRDMLYLVHHPATADGVPPTANGFYTSLTAGAWTGFTGPWTAEGSLGSGISESSGVVTVTDAGAYEVSFSFQFRNTTGWGGSFSNTAYIRLYVNNVVQSGVARTYDSSTLCTDTRVLNLPAGAQLQIWYFAGTSTQAGFFDNNEPGSANQPGPTNNNPSNTWMIRRID